MRTSCISRIVLSIFASALLCGCSKTAVENELTFSDEKTEVVSEITVSSNITCVSGVNLSSITISESDAEESRPEIPAGAFLADEMNYLIGVTGHQFGYEGEWCALILWDIIAKNGYEAKIAFDPCDLAVNLLNTDNADFYCFREENFESLLKYGLENQNRVTMTNREDFVPQKGDMVCYLWDYDRARYNWSHIGVIDEDYDNSGYIRTIEGNLGSGADTGFHSVQRRTRDYGESVIGFIRLVQPAGGSPVEQ